MAGNTGGRSLSATQYLAAQFTLDAASELAALEGWMIYPFLVAGALQGFISPAMQGIMSNQVPASEQGELQGGIASMSSLTAIISPVFMTQLFGFFTATTAPVYFAGAPWLAAAVLTVLSLALFLKATASLDLESRSQPA